MAFRPLPAERPQRFRQKRFLQNREHGFFLAPEMVTRGRQRLFEQELRLRRPGCAMDAFKVVVNFVMILMQTVQRPPVSEGVIQGGIGQIRFGFAMATQQTFHHRRQQLHLGGGVGAGQDPFDLIKHFAKNRVFHNKGFCDGFHVIIDGTLGRSVQVRAGEFFRQVRSRPPAYAGLAIRTSRLFSSCKCTGLLTTMSTDADDAPASSMVLPAPVIRMTGVPGDSVLIILATA